jgi:hypothetical protein
MERKYVACPFCLCLAGLSPIILDENKGEPSLLVLEPDPLKQLHVFLATCVVVIFSHKKTDSRSKLSELYSVVSV